MLPATVCVTPSHLLPGAEPVARKLPHIELLVSIVVSALRHLVRVRALPVHPVASPGVENCAKGTAVLPGHPADAEVVLTTVGGMSVLGEDPGGALGALELPALLVHHQAAAALSDLVRPSAASALLVVGEAGRTLVPIGLPVLTHPEYAAVFEVLVGSPGAGAVRGGDGRLQLSPLPALHQVQLVALLQGEGRVRVYEAEAVATRPQRCLALRALPVLVTAVEVGIVTLQRVGATEVVHQLSSAGHTARQQQYQPGHQYKWLEATQRETSYERSCTDGQSELPQI